MTTGATPDVTDLVIALTERVAEVADVCGRVDLGEDVRASGRGFEHIALPVSLIGPSDSGKSTLLNALLHSAVSPVDPIGATSLPLIVRGAPGPPSAVLYIGNSELLDTEVVNVEDLATLLVRRLDDPEPSGIAAVEVTCDRALLRRGTILVDVPSLRRQGRAQRRVVFDLLGDSAVLVVLDSSQELDKPWVDLLQERRRAGQWCAVVFTKTDLSPHWRLIASASRATLEANGLDVPVVSVSSTLRDSALRTGDSELNARSGFPMLVAIMLDRAVEPFRRRFLAETVVATQQALAELRGSIELVEVDAASGPSVAERLEDLAVRQQRLHSAKAEFPRRLQERLEQLQLDFDAIVARSLRDLNEGAIRYIETHDPAAAWSDLTALVNDEVEEATSRIFAYLHDELALIADEMTTILGDEIEGLAVGLDRGAFQAACANVRLEKLRRTRSGKSELALDVVRGSAGGSAVAYGLKFPLIMLGLSGLIAVPIAAVFTLMLGRKALRAAKENRISTVRRQAQQQFGRYFVDLQAESTAASRRMMAATRHRVREGVDRHYLVLARALEADRHALAQVDQSAPTDAARRRAITEQHLARMLELEKVSARLRFRLERAI